MSTITKSVLKISMASLLALATIGLAGKAQAAGAYANVELGYTISNVSNPKGENSAITYSDKGGFNGGIGAGYMFSDNFGIQLSLHDWYYTSSAKVLGTSTDIKFNTYGLIPKLRLTAPVSDSLKINGLIGAGYTTTSMTVGNDNSSTTNSSYAWTAGANLEFKATDSFGITAGADYSSLYNKSDDLGLGTVNLNVGANFYF
ncbi:MAG: porin family protein [Candidatus Pacebacteria bacterium]|nr:porin family protein [Candidatus Paceibacterota bacterium]